MLNLYKFFEHPNELTLYSAMGETFHVLEYLRNGTSLPKDKLKPFLPIITKDPELALTYAYIIEKKRWPEGEPAIMRRAESAFVYACEIIKGRWEDAEPTIMKDPEMSYQYARDVIKGRWFDGEQSIMKDPAYAFRYAIYILAKDPEWTSQSGHENGRWPVAEPYIMKNEQIWSQYRKQFNIPENE